MYKYFAFDSKINEFEQKKFEKKTKNLKKKQKIPKNLKVAGNYPNI